MPGGSTRRLRARTPQRRAHGSASSTLWPWPVIQALNTWSSSHPQISASLRQQGGGVGFPAYPDGLADGVGFGQVPIDVLAGDGDELVEALDLDEIVAAIAEIGLGAEPPGNRIARVPGRLAMQVQLFGPERDRHIRAGGERLLGRRDVETAETPGIDAG